uniref:Uncharacterized protein n=1 Tax=Heliothis virescens TaxID=7102 RepID=A0A2A4JYX9_HELVI
MMSTNIIKELLDLEWWIYLFLVLSFFIVCLGLNYVVKKINEAKIDERFIRMLHKASTTQATQVNGPLIVMETSKLRQNSSKSPQPSPTGISLVFNQEDNKRKQDLDEAYDILKNTIDPKRFESLSLNSKFSHDSIDVPIIRTDRCLNEIVSSKIIEVAHKVSTPAPIEISSLTQNICNGTGTKTPLVKNNEYGYPSATSIHQNECYVTEVMTVKSNDVEYVPSKRASACISSDNNRTQIIALKDTERIIAKETTYLIKSDNNDRDKNVPKPKSKSTDESPNTENEATPSGPQNVNVNEPSSVKKNEPNRTVPKPNVPGITLTESKIREAIKKAKEEMDMNLKKKAQDANLLQTTDTTKTIKEGSQSSKAASLVVAKETVPQSGRSVTEKPIKISDPTEIVAKNNSSHTKSDLKTGALCSLKMSDSDATKNTASHALGVANVKPLISKKSGQLATKDTSLHIKSDNSITKLSSAKKTDHVTKQVTSSHTKTDQKVSREVTHKIEENVVSDISSSNTQSERHGPTIISVTKIDPDKLKPNKRHTQEALEKPLKINSDRLIATPTAAPELGREAAKATSLYARSDPKESDGVTVKKDLNTTIATAPHTETHNTAKLVQEAVKPTLLPAQGDRKDKEDVTVKKEPNTYLITATSSHTQTHHSADTTKKSGLIQEAVKAILLHEQSVKKSEEIAAKIETERNVPAIIPAKIDEPVTKSETTANRQTSEGVAGKKEEIKPVRKAPVTISSCTQTDPKITKFGKKYEPDRKETKMFSTLGRSDHKSTDEVAKTEKSGPIVATETTASGIIPASVSGRIAAKEITVDTPNNRNVTELVPITMGLSTNKSQNNEDENTFSQRSDVGNIRINDPQRLNMEKSVPGFSAIKKSNTHMQSTSIAKKTIEPNVAQNDEPRGSNESPQTGLKERLKALLTPPVMNEDVMVLKPNPSSKK